MFAEKKTTACRIRHQHQATRVIMLTGDRNHDSVVRSLRAGAAAYVWKGSEFSELALAIKAASIGRSFISPAVSNEFLGNYFEGEPAEIKQYQLTPRQRQILQLIAEGHSNK